MKWLVILLLLYTLWNLVMALKYLHVSSASKKQAMVKSLSRRIIASVFLFIILLLAYQQGWIKPSASLGFLYHENSQKTSGG